MKALSAEPLSAVVPGNGGAVQRGVCVVVDDGVHGGVPEDDAVADAVPDDEGVIVRVGVTGSAAEQVVWRRGSVCSNDRPRAAARAAFPAAALPRTSERRACEQRGCQQRCEREGATGSA